MDDNYDDRLPQRALSFLTWFCPDHMLEGILGDLAERHESDCRVDGKKKADRRFTLSVIRFFHPSIFLKNKTRKTMFNPGLIKSHTKVSLRSIGNNKLHSFINIIGLAASFAFIFLVFSFIQSELSFDQFHEHKGSIYRLAHKVEVVSTGEIKGQSAVTAVPLSRDLKNEIPSIKSFTRLASGPVTVRVNNTPFEETLSFGDSAFFEMFDFPVIKKGRGALLSNPNSIVISEERALKYFGSKEPIGSTLSIDFGGDQIDAIVSGVIDPKKASSSIQIDLIMDIQNFEYLGSEEMMQSYKYGLLENYIHLEESVEGGSMASIMTKAIQKYSPANDTKMSLTLQRLNTIHLEDKVVGNATYSSPQKLFIMSGIGLLVLLIALVNFVTLTTGQAIGRIKEMGLRKTLGAHNGQLKLQLASESFIIIVVAAMIGIALSYALHPLFTTLTTSTFSFVVGMPQLFFIVVVAIVMALTAGLAQALLVIKYEVTDALQGNVLFGNVLFGNGSGWLNRGLIIFQFSIAIIMIISALHMNAQMSFIKNKKLGYDEERLIEISLGNPATLEESELLVERFTNLALRDEWIISVSATMNNSREPWSELGFEQADGTVEKIFYNQVDPFYLETLDIEILKGSDFKLTESNNKKSILVNEALVRHFTWGEDVLSKQIPAVHLKNDHQIIGVVEDYHFSSLHQKIEPLIIALDEHSISEGITGLSTYVWPPNLYHMLVRVGDGEIGPIVSELDKIWSETNPGDEFVYHFVDEVLANQYAEEERWSKVIRIASVFSICIAWLGLFALLRLVIQKKEKEIGIRKVLGSSSLEVIHLLSYQYMLLLMIGVLIAIPISWWAISRWLETFAYKIHLAPMLFISSCGAILLLTLVSVSLQSYRASIRNPVASINSN